MQMCSDMQELNQSMLFWFPCNTESVLYSTQLHTRTTNKKLEIDCKFNKVNDDVKFLVNAEISGIQI